MPHDTITVGGIPTVRLTRAELAEEMAADCRRARAGLLDYPRIVSSSNGYVVASYHENGPLRDALRQADIIDADGMPLVFASRLRCKRPLTERVATTDFIHDAADVAIRDGLRFFFVGAKPGVPERAADNLRALHPGLLIAGTRHGYFTEPDEPAICEEIRAARTDVLWVGLGSPMQELFAVRNRKRLAGLAWIRTCGGLFDHYDGTSRRAPGWMQSAGLEWLYRASREPGRLGTRYLRTNPVALFHLLTKTHD
jgi:exopolysaccharide biosynthesis WecB/TagA/CpsF family protein